MGAGLVHHVYLIMCQGAIVFFLFFGLLWIGRDCQGLQFSCQTFFCAGEGLFVWLK